MIKNTFVSDSVKPASGDIETASRKKLHLDLYLHGAGVASEDTEINKYLTGFTNESSLFVLGSTLLQRRKLADFQKDHTTQYTLLEQRLDDLEERETRISRRLVKLEEQNNMPGVALPVQCEQLLGELGYLRDLEDIREQLQYSTLILKALDKMFAACNEKTERFRRQLILKLRSAVKLNCDKDLFTEEQIDTLENLVKELQKPEQKKDQILTALDRLMDADLSPFPSLEDEDEAVSGYNSSN